MFAGLLVAAIPVFCQVVTPFTITEVSRVIAPDKTVKESKFLFAMNRDGSIASVDLDPSSGGPRQILDVVNHRTILVNPNTRSAAISPSGVPPFSGTCEERFRHIKGAVVSVDRSAGETQGVPLQRISVTLPNGTAMEIVVAPTLACHMIRTQTMRNGVLLEEQIAEDLHLGDPDVQLFEVPADYRITEATLSKK